jgi:hypothetical protein
MKLIRGFILILFISNPNNVKAQVKYAGKIEAGVLI